MTTVLSASIDPLLLTVNDYASVNPAMKQMPGLAEASLGDVVRFLRRQRGLTQTDLAHALDMSQKWVSDIERGIYKHSTPDTIVRVAEFFDVAEDQLLVKAGFGKSRESARRFHDQMEETPQRRAECRQSDAAMRAKAHTLIDQIRTPDDLDYALITLRRLAKTR